jgi:hypothetical protein
MLYWRDVSFDRIQDGLNSGQLNILLDKENGLYILYLH